MPYDVLYNIIESVGNVNTLLALSLVCRDFRLQVEPRIWQSLSLPFAPPGLYNTQRALNKCIAVTDLPRGQYVLQLRLSFGQLARFNDQSPDQNTRHAYVEEVVLPALAGVLRSVPNVQSLTFISQGLSDPEIITICSEMSRSECMPKLRFIFVDHRVCDISGVFPLQRIWQTHPSIVLTSVSHAHRHDFWAPPLTMGRNLSPPPSKCAVCTQLAGTPADPGAHTLPTLVIDDVALITSFVQGPSMLDLHKPLQHACLDLGLWTRINALSLVRFTSLRSLHITTHLITPAHRNDINVLTALASLPNLEYLAWSGASPTMQQRLLAPNADGGLPATGSLRTLRRILFTWAEMQLTHRRLYVREDPDGGNSVWDLKIDESERSMRSIGNSKFPVFLTTAGRTEL